MTRLLMVMPYRAYLGKAKAEGFQVGAIWDPTVAVGIFGDHAEDYLADVRAQADAFWEADFDDPGGYERVLRDAARDFGAEIVYHVGQEESMGLVGQVAEDLGLAVNSAKAVHLLNDKVALRRLLCDRDLGPVRHVDAPHWRAAAGLLNGLELPVVAKPTSLSGSRGVRLVRGQDDFASWGTMLDDAGYTGPVLIEEYLSGPEFSVETISVQGRHHVIGVTAKQLGPPPLFVETGHTHPAPAGASPTDTGRRDTGPASTNRAGIGSFEMTSLVEAMLDAVGYRTGPAHTELRVTVSGPRIIESQARLGGDRIPQLVRLATGIDLERSVFAALAGRPPQPPTRQDVARIHYLALPPGTVRSVSGVEAVRALPFVDEVSFPFRPGDRIPVTVDWRSRHGYVVVSAASHAKADERAAEAESLLTISVDTAPVDTTSVDTIPVDTAPVDTTSVDTTSVARTSAVSP
ncbi:MAG: ATP-grasp domain-containing protein [Angustibacter sp.]